MRTQSISSVTCPYCQTELTGDFHSGDMIECESCKGRFQPPPNLLKEISVSKETCPFCKTTFNVTDSAATLLQCPSCKGKYSNLESIEYVVASRPESVKRATLLLKLLILISPILYVILLLMGRATGNWQLINTVVRGSVVAFPWKLVTILLAWKLFKGGNWARNLFNVFMPLNILFVLIQALGQHVGNLADSIHANYQVETILWFNLFAATILGIGALCGFNSSESREWMRLPKDRKNSPDSPWWIVVLLVVFACTSFVFLCNHFETPVKNQSTKGSVSLQEQQAIAAKYVRFASSSESGSAWERYLSDKPSYGREASNDSDDTHRTLSSDQQKSPLFPSGASPSEKSVVQTGVPSLMVNAAGERRVISVGGIDFAIRWCPATTSIEWKRLSGGKDFFSMGIRPSEKNWYLDLNPMPQNTTLTKGFWLGETEVTVELWRKIMHEVPILGPFGGGDKKPITNVSWYECKTFIEKLNDKTPIPGFTWNLPTEAQWEYACRAGTTTTFSWGSWWEAKNGDKANINMKNRWPTDVSSFAPNPWGIYDMHGNVKEWCSDWFGVYPGGIEVDPTGPQSGQYRVVRGGSFSSYASSCCSSARDKEAPKEKSHLLGFRVALVPAQ